MSGIPNTALPFVREDLRLTGPGVQLLESMRSEIAELQAELAALSAFKAAVMAIVEPAGGGTQDAEARAAIAALIAAAQ